MKGSSHIVILASGRGTNFAAILAAITRGEIPGTIIRLVTDNAAAPAIGIARAHRIPVEVIDCGHRQGRIQKAARPRLLKSLKDADVIACAGFMRILPPGIVQAHRGRILNVHPSLLPAFPGLNAPRQAIDRGVRIAGCTVHFIDEGTDTGPIILQEAVRVGPGDTAETLAARILPHEHRLYALALRLLCEGRLSIRNRHVTIDEESSTCEAPRSG
jgi:phosphoribosylglycinamide formyltransferase-1